jgi:6-phosphogluconate dehydrogenase (decarboxylating)
MIGVGKMGDMMSLLFAEHGIEVHFYDPSEQNVHTLLDHAREAKNHAKI